MRACCGLLVNDPCSGCRFNNAGCRERWRGRVAFQKRRVSGRSTICSCSCSRLDLFRWLECTTTEPPLGEEGRGGGEGEMVKKQS